ncbi:histidine phosphatase family protein [Sphaerotilus mobilis]|uniref:phosphoglycerate mutase (2,3-diphosphoglycerate-dependent) n=1 Tax=Sphaerotilus mobilis TaxID=47994 RepID=A0A4Q7LPY3_9BURK|nr:histidine phosphatase family protein [Sphaerotilus mobilis]RZS56836.1 broad specificity phosphatase PhoE [Sphaerotilus mobilis]
MPRTGSLILVRHGRTAGNGQQHVGWLDLPLDEVGEAQARRAAELLRDRPIAALHASTLQRAVVTAQAIQAGRDGLVLQRHEALREIDYGIHTGRSKDGPPLRLRHTHIDQPMPGGESLADVERRVDAWLPTLAPPLSRGDTVVVVAHFWSLRLLLGRLRALDVRGMLATRDYKPANGSVVVLPVQVHPEGGPARCGLPVELANDAVTGTDTP